MEHFSELLKILDGALRHNVRQAMDYAGLLADKLTADGNQSQAQLIRQRLARIPQAQISGQLLGNGAPLDKESKLGILDEAAPGEETAHLVTSDTVKRRLDEFILGVRRYDDLAAEGVALPLRLMLYGPPGCGKTLAARWIAAQLQRPLLTVRCDTLVSSLLGQTSRNLRQVFEHAETRPCVLLLDEFDALGKSRSDEREVGELQRIVIALLQNIDALSPSTIVIAATNHDELLDRAVWRRFNFTISLGLPDPDQRRQLWGQKLGRFSLKSEELEILVKYSDGMSGAAIETAAYDSVRDAVLHGTLHAGLPSAMRHLASLQWLANRAVPSTEGAEIRALRAWAPEVFTYRVLEKMFERNTRQVRNALGERDERTRQADTSRRITKS